MKLTNRYGLPDTFFQAVLNDKYSRGNAHYSATDLIRPPRITILSRRYGDEIEEDVSDRIWSVLGKAVHAILQAAETDNALTEERLFCEIGGRIISGASDLYEDGVVTDYKVTSVWTRIFGSRIVDWTQQLNIYGYLFRQIGFPVSGLRTICIYRDWSAGKANQKGGFPQLPVEEILIPLWKAGQQRKFILGRVELLNAGENLPDDQLQPCTPEEMWEKPTTFAVMKEGRKSAVKVCQTENQAVIYKDKHAGSFIQVRPGERTRCEKYCPVAQFCNQFARYLADLENQNDEPLTPLVDNTAGLKGRTSTKAPLLDH